MTERAFDIPQKLRQRPRFKGLPIPYTTMIVNGIPDFKVVDEYTRLLCIERRLCALCGQELKRSKPIVFIGGENCCTHGKFLDPAMHEECAMFAVKVCPYLTGTHEHRITPLPQEDGKEFAEYPLVTTERPKRMGLYYTRGYDAMDMGIYGIYIKAWQATKVDWDTIPPGPDKLKADGDVQPPIACPAQRDEATPLTADTFVPKMPICPMKQDDVQ